VDPVPGPLLLRKSGSAWNRTQIESGSVDRNSDHYTTEAVKQGKYLIEIIFTWKLSTQFPSNNLIETILLISKQTMQRIGWAYLSYVYFMDLGRNTTKN
jgi:hypothetical protein